MMDHWIQILSCKYIQHYFIVTKCIRYNSKLLQSSFYSYFSSPPSSIDRKPSKLKLAQKTDQDTPSAESISTAKPFENGTA